MSSSATASILDTTTFNLQDTRFMFFIYGTVLCRLMLSYIFSDPLMGSRFVQRFKVEKFDLRKEVVLGGNLEL
jgi:hypothetical protein